MAELREKYDKLVRLRSRNVPFPQDEGRIGRLYEELSDDIGYDRPSGDIRDPLVFGGKALLFSQYLRLGKKRWSDFKEGIITKASQYSFTGVEKLTPDEQKSIEKTEEKHRDLSDRRSSIDQSSGDQQKVSDNYKFDEFNNERNKVGKLKDDWIYIVNIDNKDDKVEIYTIPYELSYESESSHAVIKAMGRNNPLYQFTGSEDRLEFEVIWYNKDGDKDQVIRNCRKLESFSKSDGYRGKKLVTLIWGETNRLFADHTFVVLQAPYKITRFSRYHINKNNVDGIVTNDELMPVRAIQKVVLARVSSYNLTHEDINRIGEKESSEN